MATIVPRLSRLVNALFAVQTSQGTPATISAANGAVNCFNIKFTPTVNTVERTFQGLYLGEIKQAVGDSVGKLAFETELVSSSTGNTTNWSTWGQAPLWQCCNAQITVAGGNATGNITPYTNASSLLTANFWIDNRLFILSDAMGNCKIDFKAGHPSRCSWEFMGVLQPITDGNQTTYAPTYESIVAPRAGGNFTYGNQACIAPELSFDLGNDVQMRGYLGGQDTNNYATGQYSAWITQRKPKMTFAPEALALTSFDPWTVQKNATTFAINLALNGGTGNTFTINAPAAQITKTPEPGDRNGFYIDSIEATLIRSGYSVGDNEWTISLA